MGVFALNAVTVAGFARTIDGRAYGALVGERLAEGVVPAHLMRRLARDIDKYVSGLLIAAKAPAVLRAEAVGALQPKAPDFTGSFVELTLRLAAEPEVARVIPRQIDLIIFERLVRRRHVPTAAIERLRLDDTDAAAGF